MQQARTWNDAARNPEDLSALLPLYAASVMVTLAGVGAVGVTVTMASWTPVWVVLTVLGHAVSLGLRRLRVGSETVFYPVMVLGTGAVLKLAIEGSPLVGMDIGLGSMPTDMATAAVVGAIAVLRTFTLVTNGACLFSPVPAITMLALVGSSNPNAEVPLFFGLLMLGSLFLSGYETHLRRIAQGRRPSGAVLLHLLVAWCISLAVAGVALVFPLGIKPLIGPLSPFALPAVSRLNSLMNFTQPSSNQAPVGQGPISLSPIPLYEIYTADGGRFRTDSFTRYTGRGWTIERMPSIIDISSDEQTQLPTPVPGGVNDARYRFRFPRDPDLPAGIPTRLVRQRLLTKGYASDGIPSLGRIVELQYPRSTVYLRGDGSVSGNGHMAPNRTFELVSEVPAYPDESLQKSPPVDAASFYEPESLDLPQSTLEVQELARRTTTGIAQPYAKIKVILDYIERTCRYTLQEEVTPTGEDAAAYYLFKTRRGACDLSATAAAIMCRSVGIPARVAVGYVGEEPLPLGGGYLIRQEHAHMWLEAYLEGIGWVPFDPAPPLAQIRDNPLDIAWTRIRTLLSRVGGGGLDAAMLVIILAVTLGLVAYRVFLRARAFWRDWQRGRRALRGSPAVAVAGLYARSMALLDRRGWPRAGWMTPTEYLDSLRGEWAAAPEALAALETLTRRFECAHYAGEASPEDLAAAHAGRAALTRHAPSRRQRRSERRRAAAAAQSPL